MSFFSLSRLLSSTCSLVAEPQLGTGRSSRHSVKTQTTLRAMEDFVCRIGFCVMSHEVKVYQTVWHRDGACTHRDGARCCALIVCFITSFDWPLHVLGLFGITDDECNVRHFYARSYVGTGMIIAFTLRLVSPKLVDAKRIRRSTRIISGVGKSGNPHTSHFLSSWYRKAPRRTRIIHLLSTWTFPLSDLYILHASKNKYNMIIQIHVVELLWGHPLQENEQQMLS